MSGSIPDANDPSAETTSDQDEAITPHPGEITPHPGDLVTGTNGGGVPVAASRLDLWRVRSALRDHAEPLALVAITAVAAAVRFSTLDVQSFDHDESVTALLVLHPGLVSTLSAVAHLERNPPLYYVLAWAWSKVFGSGQDDLRLLSAVLGTLTVPAAYLAANELASRRAGVIAAGLIALNPFLVWYSQEARSYALLVLFLTLGLFLFARARRAPTRSNLALWSAASALALCSHYFAVFVVAPECVLLIAMTRPRGRALVAGAATAAVGLALAPLAIVQQSGRPPDPFASAGILGRSWEILVHFAASVEPPILGSGAVGLLQVAVGIGEVAFVLAAVSILWRLGSRAERRSALVVSGVGAAAFGVPVVLAVGGLDFVNARNMIGSLVPLLVAAGVALGCSRAGRAGRVVAVAACALLAGVLIAVNLSPQMQRPDWRAGAQAIGAAPNRGVVVVPPLAQTPISYYLGAEPVRFGSRPVLVRHLEILSKGLHQAPRFHGFKLIAERRGVEGRFWLRRYDARRPRSFSPSLVPSSRLILGYAHQWRFVPPARVRHRG